ncbi:MAG: S41 family peptidase [Candidatus Omnitrophica bacterium]|nr:S41 family peptidase [Candidatus Omnitrophota bacterium]
MRRRWKVFLPILAAAFLAAGFMVQAEDGSIVDENSGLFEQVQLLADSLTLISTDYVEPVKVKDLIYGAIRGMTGTLDGYSQFLDPESFKEITEEAKGEFGGVGIEIGIREGILTVIAPIEDTPAFTAGIKAGDRIVRIDGEAVRDMMLDNAVKMLRGEPGTKVNITVLREGVDNALDLEITRAVIKLKSITDAGILEGEIGYIKLIEFQQRTPEDLKRSMEMLAGKGAKSVILDLRNNPGGLLDAAVEAADYFLEPGRMIVYTEGRDPEKRVEFRSEREPVFPGLNMIVLVDRGSASASEILAGAIKDNKRGVIVGVPTFGKGSVQTVVPLNDGSAIRITTAAYFTPSGKNLRDKGIDPDIHVKYFEGEAREKEKTKKMKDKETGDEGEGERIKEDGPDKGGTVEPEDRGYDSQLSAAINVLKGFRVFEDYRTDSLSGEEASEG